MLRRGRPAVRQQLFDEIRALFEGGHIAEHIAAVLRQIDATDPPFDPSATKTELVGDLPQRNCQRHNPTAPEAARTIVRLT